MTMAGKDWERLASYVTERMKVEKIRTKAELRRRTGLSIPTIAGILAGVPRNGGDVSDETLGKLDDGLRWGPDSSAAILAGGEPTDAAPSAGGATSLPEGPRPLDTSIETLEQRVSDVNAKVDALRAIVDEHGLDLELLFRVLDVADAERRSATRSDPDGAPKRSDVRPARQSLPPTP